MAAKANLRTVRPDESGPKKLPLTVAQAAKNGTPRELLVAMRDLVAETLVKPNCPPREFTSLTKRLQDIVKDIELIDARDVDDVARRVHDLESALREVAPGHLLLSDYAEDRFDAEAL